ncbi:MAG: hypothetical protein QMD36_00770 [Candidatus Aenigmarchaeota archaeon]|nr:hypothetical protein [Candidatus Aenigmarchaeota archaeon]
MSKGLSIIVGAVILIAATMSIAGILIYWTSGFVQKRLSESGNVTDETACLGAEFKIHSANFANGTLVLFLDNRRTVDLTLENLYLFYPDNSMETVPLNVVLKGNEIKQLTLTNITDGFTGGKIKTHCPTVFLDFTYSEGVIR